MTAYAAGLGVAAALLLGGKPAAVAAAAGTASAASAPVWARMRWIDYSWQMILPKPGMHPAIPPGQKGGPKGTRTGTWMFWKLGANGWPVNVKTGQPASHVLAKGTHEIEHPVGQGYLYVWYPEKTELQNINGYWILNGKRPGVPPPGVSGTANAKGSWQPRAGSKTYWVWLTKANMHEDAYLKQFAWFTFHQRPTTGVWAGSPIIATSSRGVTLPDETDASGNWIFLLSPQMAAADDAVLKQQGATAPSDAPAANSTTSNPPSAASSQPQASA
jgi:hypothetical protein